MDSCIEHEEHERSLFPRRIVEVESEEQVRPSLRLVRGRFSHAKDRVIIRCAMKTGIFSVPTFSQGKPALIYISIDR